MAVLPMPQQDAVVDAIYEVYKKKARSFDSIGLPAGQAGNECPRFLWYLFRWAAKREVFTGQKLRLFETGNREEDRIVQNLEDAGYFVEGQQTKFFAVFGHVRGKIDGTVVGIPGAEATAHILECKTANQKNFNQVKKHGVKKAKPEHFLQCQLYMHWSSNTRCLYVMFNKNDEAFHIERLRHDPDFCVNEERRLSDIIFAKQPPEKLHEDPSKKAAFQCGYCLARDICHEQGAARVNCRTCIHSTPQKSGDWRCERYACSLSTQEQKEACPDHLYVPELVPLEQVDANPDENWIEYVMPSGDRWRDTGKEKAA